MMIMMVLNTIEMNVNSLLVLEESDDKMVMSLSEVMVDHNQNDVDKIL